MPVNNTSGYPSSIGEPENSQDTPMPMYLTPTNWRRVTVEGATKRRKLNNMRQRNSSIGISTIKMHTNCRPALTQQAINAPTQWVFRDSKMSEQVDDSDIDSDHEGDMDERPNHTQVDEEEDPHRQKAYEVPTLPNLENVIALYEQVHERRAEQLKPVLECIDEINDRLKTVKLHHDLDQQVVETKNQMEQKLLDQMKMFEEQIKASANEHRSGLEKVMADHVKVSTSNFTEEIQRCVNKHREEVEQIKKTEHQAAEVKIRDVRQELEAKQEGLFSESVTKSAALRLQVGNLEKNCLHLEKKCEAADKLLENKTKETETALKNEKEKSETALKNEKEKSNTALKDEQQKSRTALNDERQKAEFMLKNQKTAWAKDHNDTVAYHDEELQDLRKTLEAENLVKIEAAQLQKAEDIQNLQIRLDYYRKTADDEHVAHLHYLSTTRNQLSSAQSKIAKLEASLSEERDTSEGEVQRLTASVDEKTAHIQSQAQIIQTLESELEEAHSKTSTVAREMTVKVDQMELKARQLSSTLEERQVLLYVCSSSNTRKSRQINDLTRTNETLVHRMHGLSIENDENSLGKAAAEEGLRQAIGTIRALRGEASLQEYLLSCEENATTASRQKFKDLEDVYKALLGQKQRLVEDLASFRTALYDKDMHIDDLTLKVAGQENILSIRASKIAAGDHTIEELRASNADAVTKILGFESKVSSLQADLEDRNITLARESEVAATKLHEAQLTREVLESANKRLLAEITVLMEGLKGGMMFRTTYNGEDAMATIQRLSNATLLLTLCKADGGMLIWHGDVERCTLEFVLWNWHLCWVAEDMETVHRLYVGSNDQQGLQAWLEAAKMGNVASGS